MQNNKSNNAEFHLKKLTERIKFESKSTKHGTVMEHHAKLQVISIPKKSDKNFTSANPELKVDQIYSYIAASPDILVTRNCCGNGVVEIKCPEYICESVRSEEKIYYLIEVVHKQNLIKLKTVFCLNILKLSFRKNTLLLRLKKKNLILKNILKNLTWFWHNQLATYLL